MSAALHSTTAAENPTTDGVVHDDGTSVFRDRYLWRVAGVGATTVSCVKLRGPEVDNGL
jgi:hypothetical protein